MTSEDEGPKPSSPDILRLAVGLLAAGRPRQWIKNSFVLAPLIFSGQFLKGPAPTFLALLGAAAFTLVSIATYLINDVADLRTDRQHPVKRHRPIASGRVPVRLALFAAGVAGASGLVLGFGINASTFLVLAGYLVLQLAYTTVLKHLAILDVLCVALGFVLRVIAGSVAIPVEPTAWLLVCTFFLATFLGFAKRAGEGVRLRAGAGSAEGGRPVLIVYHDRLLLALLSTTCGLTLLSYALYTIERRPYSPILLGTVPVVAYGLFRYLLAVLSADEAHSAESPETLLLRDRELILAGFLWALLCVVAILMSPAA